DSSGLEALHFTITAWVKAPSSPGQDLVLVAKGADSCGEYSYALTTGPKGGLTFVVLDSAGGGMITTQDIDPSLVWDGSWHLLAAADHGSAMQVLVDDILLSTDSSWLNAPKFGLTDDAFTLGGPPSPCPSGHSFVGLLDDVRYYPSALVAPDLAGLMPPKPTTSVLDPVASEVEVC